MLSGCAIFSLSVFLFVCLSVCLVGSLRLLRRRNADRVLGARCACRSPRLRRGETSVVVALCTLLVIPAAHTEAVYFSEKDPVGRERFRPVIDKMYERK